MFEIKLFGAIEITRDGEPLTDFRSQKALALLAYLFSEGRPITREYLAGLGWPETGQGQALGLLRRTLYNLNQQLPNCLDISQRTIFFRLDAPVDVDLRQFARLAAQPDAAAWIAAADLYRAPFLEGVYLADCPVFEQWLSTEQQRWQEQMDNVLTRLIRTLSDQGDYAGALTYANRRLALAPWHEEAHRQVMRLHLYSGQRSAALAQYDRCVAILADELDVEPDEQTRALYAQIKQAAPYPPHNLSPQATPFWGRQTELAELTALIANPSQRLITLVGPGGMGKTRLAIAAAERQLGRPAATADPSSPTYAYFTHGVYLVTLTAIETAGGLLPTIAEALNFRIEADSAQRTSNQQLLDYLRAKRLLLILDNFEQLLTQAEATEATGLLLEILRVAPEVQLLVTSRERLQIMPEQLYPVQGLTYPDALPDAETAIHDYPALALFTQISQHIQPGFRCEGEMVGTVIQICQTVSGMPLAIELAAAAITTLSPAEILAELTHSLDLLTTTTRHIADRHRSMRAAFETSWRQLSQSEQAVFAQLSVFRGGFTREAAAAVTAASLSVLTGLANKSFFRYRQRTQRYEVHELLRQFGAEKLAHTTDQGQRASHQHSLYFAAKLAHWGNEAKGAHQQAAYQTMAAEAENIRLVWQWAVGEGDFPLLAQAVDGLGIFYQWQGRYQEGSDLYQAANQVLRAAAEELVDRQVLLIKVLTWQGIFEQSLGHTQSALSLFEEALRRDDGDQPALEPSKHRQNARALLWYALGDVYLHIARSKAKTYFEQSIAAYQTLDDTWGLSRAYHGLSSLCREVGDYPTAKELAEKSLALRAALGDQRGIADSLGWLGVIALDMGELAQAETFTLQKLTIHRSLKNQPGIASGLDNLGLVDMFLGRFGPAQQKFEESLAIYTDLGVQQRYGTTHIWLGIALCMQGRYRDALADGQIALSLVEAASNVWAVAHAHMLLGYLTLALGRSAEARAHLQASIDSFTGLGQPDELSQAWAWMSHVELACGQLTAAQSCLENCFQIALEVRTFLPVLEALPAAARLLCRQEEPALAIEIYALAMTFPVLAKAMLIEDLAGKTIRAATEMLPPAVVAAAQERGRQRDLWETVAALLAQFAAIQ